MPIKIQVPGSKSIANRALILSALTNFKTTLKNLPECDDTKYLLRALKKLQTSKKTPIKLHTGNAGTTTRFLTAYCTLLSKHIIIDGDKRMKERPIKELVDALKKLGADISCKKNCPPVEIKPQIPKGGTIKLPGNISSQYISAILLAAPHFTGKTTINIEQELCSQPYINLTIKTQNTFDFTPKNNKFAQFKVSPQKGKSPKNYTIESDASGASYIGAFAALNPAWTILLSNIHHNSLQGDIAFLKYLKKMGCKITPTKKGTRIRGPKELKRLGAIDMNKTPDLVMTFAALAMFTPGKTTIKNIANLRIKETNRLLALKNEIKKFGIKVETTKDSITIHGDPIHLKSISKKISIKTYNDHRIAMCFAILNNRFPNLHIQNPKCVNKSYPTFWEDLEMLEQAQPKRSNIVLTGMRGSGKTHYGKILAKTLSRKFIDTDDLIVKESKYNSISKIVEKKGWKFFRRLEKEIAKKVSEVENHIISTGGGLIIDKENEKNLKKTGIIVFLNRPIKECAKYVKLSKIKRPALTDQKNTLKELNKVWKERRERYEKSANQIINIYEGIDLSENLNLYQKQGSQVKQRDRRKG